MTNPGNALGTNGAYGGRTSVDASNDILAGYEGRGILSGWQCAPKAGLTLAFGGNGVSRDVALAEDDLGNKTTINNRSDQPVDLTLADAPSLGQRIDVIVAYVNNPPEGTNTAIDNPGACGLIDVQGEVVANNPTMPTEDDIRTAIGLDGGSSTNSYYVVLATVAIGEGVTDITSDDITQGPTATLRSVGIGDGAVTTPKLADNAVTSDKIATGAVKSENVDWATIKRTLWEGQLGNHLTGLSTAITLSDNIANYKYIEVVVGLNNWGANNGIVMYKFPSSTMGCPISFGYAVKAEVQQIRFGVLGIERSNKMYWRENRSFTKILDVSGSSQVVTPKEEDEGIMLYKVIGYVK